MVPGSFVMKFSYDDGHGGGCDDEITHSINSIKSMHKADDTLLVKTGITIAGVGSTFKDFQCTSGI